MNGFVETHRSFVNTWECDDNAHMNVQFYFKRFDEAARFLAGMNGGDMAGPLPRTRHVRYHAELHAGGITRTLSAIVADGRFAGYTVHLLEDIETGRVAATALDAPTGIPAAGNQVRESDVEQALPRGVDAAPSLPMPPREVLALGGLVSSRTIVQPMQCDAVGELLAQGFVGRLSDAAAHVWEVAGVGIARLRELGYGRVALEMKLTHHQPAKAGDALLIHSHAVPTGGKALQLHHEITRFADGAPVATAQVVAVILDLTTRKSVAMPLAGSAGA
ncbi:thioesterase [Aquibium carbonis]|uniref:Thioesterase n=1 Tax=Aquibium carbonis TaxID=2495581 RepID=A0A3R9YAX5_9HYPH|nr:thioesterase family protein [Aquibium carbonis]RST87087.1 thioesterase [Aquibium carbonis]